MGNMWKTRWENTNHSLLQMVEERSQNQTTITNMKTKVDRLEKLCRALQTERKTLRKQLQGDQEPLVTSPEPTAEIGDSHSDNSSPSPLPDFPVGEKECPGQLADEAVENIREDESELPEADKEMCHCDENLPEEKAVENESNKDDTDS